MLSRLLDFLLPVTDYAVYWIEQREQGFVGVATVPGRITVETASLPTSQAARLALGRLSIKHRFTLSISNYRSEPPVVTK